MDKIFSCFQKQTKCPLGKTFFPRTATKKDAPNYLYSLKQGDKNDENIKRGIINIFLRAVYLYDDRFTLVLNGSDTPITIDDILLDEIEEGLEGDPTSCEGCSSLVADAPPVRAAETNRFRGPLFFLYTLGLIQAPEPLSIVFQKAVWNRLLAGCGESFSKKIFPVSWRIPLPFAWRTVQKWEA